jgi:hypothetical protein
MGKEIGFSSKNKSNKWIWLIIVILVICLVLACCSFIIAGNLLLQPTWRDQTVVPEPQTIPTTHPVPTESVYWVLNVDADPLYGSTSLQRGFFPDNHIVNLGEGGTIDTLDLDLD